MVKVGNTPTPLFRSKTYGVDKFQISHVQSHWMDRLALHGGPRTTVCEIPYWACLLSSKWSHQWVFCKSDCQKHGNLRKTLFFDKKRKGLTHILELRGPRF